MNRHHAFVLSFLCGCFVPSPDVVVTDDDGGYEDPTARDVAAYDALAASLEANRTQFLDEEADELVAEDNWLFWLQFPGFDPTLHGYDSASGARLDYAFPIGSGDEYNFRASPELVVTAVRDGDEIIYSAYRAGSAMELVSQASFAAPSDEQRWYAYAVDHEVIYVMLVNSPEIPQKTLMRWQPGAAPQPVTTLESIDGEFWDFDVEGNTMLFIEGGRLWHLDLATKQAEWLENETEISGNVNFESDGVLFESAAGPFFYRWPSRELVDIGAIIASSPYQLNATFPISHHYEEGLTRWGDYAIYIGYSGVFALHLTTHDIAPVLLEPRSTSPRIEYRHPAVLDNGTLFVTGLTSESGSVGADGPVYAVDLPSALP